MSKLTFITFIASAAIFGLVLSKLMSPDSPVEEMTEQALKAELGVDLDLSPSNGDKY